jgi:ABC-type multidrug transport system fused ATPase/permease subunit
MICACAGTCPQIHSQLPEIDPRLSVWNAAATLSDALDELQKRDGVRPGLDAGLRHVMLRQLLVAVAFYILHIMSSVAMPLSAFGLLRWTEADDPPQWTGFALVAALAASNTLAVLAREIFQDRCNVLGAWTFAALLGLTFRKVLRLSTADAFGNPIGKASDLLGPGADAVVGFWAALLGLLLQPLEILALVATLVVFVREAALAGVGVVLCALALSVLGGRRMEAAAAIKNAAAERHTQVVSEAVLSMRAVKFNGWEAQFEAAIRARKADELRGWRATGRWLTLVNVASNPSVDVISLAVVATLTLALGGALTPSVLASYWTLLALLHS